MKRRTEQLASTLRHALQEVIARGLSDPRISGMITITEVKIADDVKTASISVSVYPEEREELTMHGLTAAARHIRRKAGDLVAMHQLPELEFRLDKSLKKQAAVLGAIARATASSRGAPAAEGTESTPDSERRATRDAPTNPGTATPAPPPSASGEGPQETGL